MAEIDTPSCVSVREEPVFRCNGVWSSSRELAVCHCRGDGAGSVGDGPAAGEVLCQKERSQSCLLNHKLRLQGWPLKRIKKICFYL